MCKQDELDYQGCRLLLTALFRPDLYKQYRELQRHEAFHERNERKEIIDQKARTAHLETDGPEKPMVTIMVTTGVVTRKKEFNQYG